MHCWLSREAEPRVNWRKLCTSSNGFLIDYQGAGNTRVIQCSNTPQKSRQFTWQTAEQSPTVSGCRSDNSQSLARILRLWFPALHFCCPKISQGTFTSLTAIWQRSDYFAIRFSRKVWSCLPVWPYCTNETKSNTQGNPYCREMKQHYPCFPVAAS